MNEVLTIHPTYKCNLACSFCHQSRKYNDDILNIEILESILSNIKKPDIIYLMGGEISILPDKYISKLLTIVESFKVPIYIQTNLQIINSLLIKHNIIVSFDFENRPSYNITIQNMAMLDKFDITTIVSKNLINTTINKIENFYVTLNNLNTIKFLPYIHINGVNDSEQIITADEFAYFIEKIGLNKKLKIAKPYDKSNDVIITPNGNIVYSSCVTSLKSDCNNCDINWCDIKNIVFQSDAKNCKYKKLIWK